MFAQSQILLSAKSKWNMRMLFKLLCRVQRCFSFSLISCTKGNLIYQDTEDKLVSFCFAMSSLNMCSCVFLFLQEVSLGSVSSFLMLTQPCHEPYRNWCFCKVLVPIDVSLHENLSCCLKAGVCISLSLYWKQIWKNEPCCPENCKQIRQYIFNPVL